jgi:membrane-associated phospholipid phosphatase
VQFVLSKFLKRWSFNFLRPVVMRDLRQQVARPDEATRATLIKSEHWLWCLLPLLCWWIVDLAVDQISLFKWLNTAAQKLPDLFWVFFNMLGNGWGVFALLCPLLVLAPRALLATLCAGALAGILSRTLKLSLQFPRPASVLDPTSFHIVGNPLTSLAMPSGHTLTAFALATALYFCTPASKRKYAAWLFVLAALSGLARVAVGAHWPADVFAGTAIGLVSGMLGATLAQRIPERLLRAQAWPLRLASAGAMLCIYILITDRLDFDETRPFQYFAAAVASAGLVLFFKQTIKPKSQAPKR